MDLVGWTNSDLAVFSFITSNTSSLSIYTELDDRKSMWMRLLVFFPSCWDNPLRSDGSAKYVSVSFMTTENFVACGANGAAYFVDFLQAASGRLLLMS